MARDGHGDPLRHPRGNEVPHGRPPEVVPDGARHASAPAGRPPGLPEGADGVAYEARRLASLVNEQLGDDLPEPVLQGSTRATWAASMAFSSGVGYTEPAVVGLRGAGVQAQRPGLQVELRERQGQNLGLRPPAVRMGDGDGRPEILRQVPADCLVLMILEEA